MKGVVDYISHEWKDFQLVKGLINQELTGLFGSSFLHDMSEILSLYDIYEQGADFTPEGTDGDYVAADHRYKIVKTLIDKQARFLFGIPPEITLTDKIQGQENRITANQELVSEVLEQNHFYSKLVRAAKDCLIGRRLAIAVDFNDRINISFIPSLEFVYETDPNNVDIMTKFVQFYSTEVNDDKNQQRVYKKKWELNEAGQCVISEELYDGNAKLIETLMPETVTKFDYIPVWVIINNGLTGDPYGSSDVETLDDSESWFSKLSSKDMDSLRVATDQIIYTIDMNPKTTKNLSRAPGSYYDLASDPAADGKTGQIGSIENSMGYSPAMDTTLGRLRADMYASVDVPDTSSEALQGVISSGKTMEAIYWGLIQRCNEKMLDWTPALKGVINTIILGATLYPESRSMYNTDGALVTEDYTVYIDNSYPILKNEVEEKSADIIEINAKTMSRKAYMKKWRGMTDEEVESELQQIQYEQSLLEDQNMALNPVMMGEEEIEDEEDEEGEEDGDVNKASNNE